MTRERNVLIIGGYGAVGGPLASMLEPTHPGRIIVAGRNPPHDGRFSVRRIDVDDPTTFDAALEDVDLVVACVGQQTTALLRTLVSRGVSYTGITSPWLSWTELDALRADAARSGARMVLATGIEPGISSVLARLGADALGGADEIETALLLGVGDAYGPDSLAFLAGELTVPYQIAIDGRMHAARAFDRSRLVTFPEPVGERRAFTIPFRDQAYYPRTLGAKTAIAWLALDPPWLGSLTVAAVRVVGTALTRPNGSRAAIHRIAARFKRRHRECDTFALLVETRRGERRIASSLLGRRQAHATAAAAAATCEALLSGEVAPGLWLAEEALAPARFLTRLAARGIVPRIPAPSRVAA